LLLSMRGTICIYQGEELGLTEADIPFEKLQDPYGIAFWPVFKGRDGCRTPMPWTAREKLGGFSTVEAWLPVPEEHLQHAVDIQEANSASVLNTLRRFLAWRKEHPALVTGGIRFLDAPEAIVAFTRDHEAESLLTAFNLSGAITSLSIPWDVTALGGHGFAGTLSERKVTLPAYGAFFGARK
jgi:alpha-glucosidase